MKSRDEKIAANMSAKEYEMIAANDYAALCQGAELIAGRKLNKVAAVMGYLLARFPAHIATNA